LTIKTHNTETQRQPLTAGKRITLDLGKMKFCFHEESSILAEKTQFAGIANSLTGDTLWAIPEKTRKHEQI